MVRIAGVVALVVIALVACGTMDGAWGFCASHSDATSCEDAGCVWHLAPTPDAVCAKPVDQFTPLANDGCFKDTHTVSREIAGCQSDGECPAGTRCEAKSFLYGVVPTCDYAMLCVGSN